MVLEVLHIAQFLAHGADPRPITGDEATANLVKFFVTISLTIFMAYPILAPLFRQSDKDEPQISSPASTGEGSKGLIGWIGLVLLLILSMGWWLTRSSMVALTAEPTVSEDHRHTQVKGGQIAMWGDFHAEVARIESGEVRIYLSDSYGRPIAARFFDAQVSASPANDEPTTPEKEFHETTPSLDDKFRFALMSKEETGVRVRVETPGWTVTLKFRFDEENGRRSLPIWCGTPLAN